MQDHVLLGGNIYVLSVVVLYLNKKIPERGKKLLGERLRVPCSCANHVFLTFYLQIILFLHIFKILIVCLLLRERKGGFG